MILLWRLLFLLNHSSTPLYLWTTRVDTILIWLEYCGQDSTDTTNKTQQQTNTFASEQMVLLQATSPLLIFIVLRSGYHKNYHVASMVMDDSPYGWPHNIAWTLYQTINAPYTFQNCKRGGYHLHGVK